MNDNTKEINYGKLISVDQITDAQDIFKGLIALIDSMVLSFDSGDHVYGKQGLELLQMMAQNGVNDLEKLLPELEYMQDLIRNEK